MSDDTGDDFDDLGEGFEDDGFDEGFGLPLDEHESKLVQQDLVDLEAFEAAFVAEGYRGVSVFCQDCVEEHYYPWDMLRGNLELLLETGETPVHEPAFAPDPEEYIPWEYARGYVDALQDVGVDARRDVDTCPRCKLHLPDELSQANFCPRCGVTLLARRLVPALLAQGMDEQQVSKVLREIGLPG